MKASLLTSACIAAVLAMGGAALAQSQSAPSPKPGEAPAASTGGASGQPHRASPAAPEGKGGGATLDRDSKSVVGSSDKSGDTKTTSGDRMRGSADPGASTDKPARETGDEHRKTGGEAERSETKERGTSKSSAPDSMPEKGGGEASKADRESRSGTDRSRTTVELRDEQRTEIREKIVTHDVKRVDVDFDVSVGVVVPRTVEIHTLPAEVVTIVPQYRGYKYIILTDGRILIIEPSSLEIVAIIVA